MSYSVDTNYYSQQLELASHGGRSSKHTCLPSSPGCHPTLVSNKVHGEAANKSTEPMCHQGSSKPHGSSEAQQPIVAIVNSECDRSAPSSSLVAEVRFRLGFVERSDPLRALDTDDHCMATLIHVQQRT